MSRLANSQQWGLCDVFIVFVLRLGLVVLMGRIVLPSLGAADYLTLQIIDSVFLIVLVAVFLYHRRVLLSKLFNLERFNLSTMLSWGAAAGLILFILGNRGENWLRQNVMIDFAPHPLLQLTIHADRAGEFVLPFLVGAVLVPLAEELFYRGFLFPPVLALTRAFWAIVITGSVFALAHFNQVWFIEVVLVGIALTWLYYIFRSLWPCLAAHIILNAARLIMIYLAV